MTCGPLCLSLLPLNKNETDITVVWEKIKDVLLAAEWAEVWPGSRASGLCPSSGPLLFVAFALCLPTGKIRSWARWSFSGILVSVPVLFWGRMNCWLVRTTFHPVFIFLLPHLEPSLPVMTEGDSSFPKLHPLSDRLRLRAIFLYSLSWSFPGHRTSQCSWTDWYQGDVDIRECRNLLPANTGRQRLDVYIKMLIVGSYFFCSWGSWRKLQSCSGSIQKSSHHRKWLAYDLCYKGRNLDCGDAVLSEVIW